MISINTNKKYRDQIDVQSIKSAIIKTLEKNGVNTKSDISVAIVGQEEMIDLAAKFLNEPEKVGIKHPVLSFPTKEAGKNFIFPPNYSNLGEIAISVDQAKKDAKEKSKSLQKEINFLAEHGTLHLLGIHHD